MTNDNRAMKAIRHELSQVEPRIRELEAQLPVLAACVVADDRDGPVVDLLQCLLSLQARRHTQRRLLAALNLGEEFS